MPPKPLPPLPEAPSIFGWQHLVYLAVYIVLTVGALVFIALKVKKEKTIEIIIKVTGGVLLASIIWNRITLIEFYNSVWGIIPNTVCGTTSLIFGISALFLKRDHIVFHFCVYTAFWGGIVATVYPTFIGQAHYFLYQPTISGMIHHGISVFLSVLMVMKGFVIPSLKKFYAFPLGYCFLLVYGIFLLDFSNGNITEAMYIFAPLIPGTFLTWYVVDPFLILGNLGLLALWQKVIKPRLDEKKSKKEQEITPTV